MNVTFDESDIDQLWNDGLENLVDQAVATGAESAIEDIDWDSVLQDSTNLDEDEANNWLQSILRDYLNSEEPCSLGRRFQRAVWLATDRQEQSNGNLTTIEVVTALEQRLVVLEAALREVTSGLRHASQATDTAKLARGEVTDGEPF